MGKLEDTGARGGDGACRKHRLSRWKGVIVEQVTNDS